MAYSFRDYPQSPNSRSKGPARPQPSKLPEPYQIFPSPDPHNPFGNLPKIQPPQKPLDIWNDPPIPAPDLRHILPTWPVPGPPPPGTNPFPDPSRIRLPPISPPQELPPHDLDPSNFPGQRGNEPGGLLGRLLALLEGRTQ